MPANDLAEVWLKLPKKSTVMATSGEPKCVLCTVELSAQESYCQLREKGVDALNTAGRTRVLNEVGYTYDKIKYSPDNPQYVHNSCRKKHVYKSVSKSKDNCQPAMATRNKDHVQL